PAALTPEEAKHILGAQGNVWTEYIATPEYAEYMAYPRAMALAEVLWTPEGRKSWSSFQERLKKQVDRLDGMKVNYAQHSLGKG
ncbi:MAG TPA: family 20 glycosylhydrolase, partial [Saprospiraceae bacterium]|nr:family 20 glycosylhydrolase [Saprospiraceae bacterium]